MFNQSEVMLSIIRGNWEKTHHFEVILERLILYVA